MSPDRVPGPFDDAVDEETRRRGKAHERHLEGTENEKKVQDALERAQASYREEFERLHDIAVDVYNGSRGGFIRKYADAFTHADVWNKRLMRPVWEALIRKYGLEEDPTGSGASEPRENP